MDAGVAARLPDRRCRPTGATCSRTSGWPTSPARSSGSAASARGRGSCCCSAATTAIRCSCRPRRPSRRCCRSSSGRVVTSRTASGSSHGQRLMQATSDIFLGWQNVDGLDGVQRDFYVRQLQDWKGSAVVETMAPQGMGFYGQTVRPDAGPRPRPLRRSDRHRLLPRRQRRVRPGARRVLRGLRRPERARLRRAGGAEKDGESSSSEGSDQAGRLDDPPAGVLHAASPVSRKVRCPASDSHAPPARRWHAPSERLIAGDEPKRSRKVAASAPVLSDDLRRTLGEVVKRDGGAVAPLESQPRGRHRRRCRGPRSHPSRSPAPTCGAG